MNLLQDMCMYGRGEEVQRTRIFFNDAVGTVQEEGTAFRMYLAIVSSGERLLLI